LPTQSLYVTSQVLQTDTKAPFVLHLGDVGRSSHAARVVTCWVSPPQQAQSLFTRRGSFAQHTHLIPNIIHRRGEAAQANLENVIFSLDWGMAIFSFQRSGNTRTAQNNRCSQVRFAIGMLVAPLFHRSNGKKIKFCR